MTTTADLRAIFEEARPLVEQALDLTEQFAALRDAATAKGIDWSQIKALVKAAVQDERNADDGKRVNRIIEKADFASAYADMLGLKMNEKNFSAEPAGCSIAAPPPRISEPLPSEPYPELPRELDRNRPAAAFDKAIEAAG